MKANITYLTDVVTVTCVIKHGLGEKAVAVAREIGVSGEIIYNARGAGLRERLGIWGIALEMDKDVVTMITSIEKRDALIHHLYTRLRLNQPGAGGIYSVALDKVATYIPEEMLQELQNNGES